MWNLKVIAESKHIRLPLVLTLFLVLLLPVFGVYILLDNLPDWMDRLYEYLKKRGNGRIDI